MTESKTILIADDDRALVAALKSRCRSLGIHVVTAHDTLSTISKIREAAPDIVCLDRNMPGGDALSVCEMVTLDGPNEQASPVQKRMPIIVLTGQTDEATIQACGELDVHYVAKDGDPWDSIGPLIRQLLDLELLEREPAEESRGATLSEVPCTSTEIATVAVSGDSADSQSSRVEFQTDECGPADRRTLLVIEDDPGVVEIVRRFLRQSNFEVIHCAGLDDAQRMAGAADAVLCDVHIPGTRGTFIILELRKAGYTGPIIVITGDSTRLTIMECVRSGVDGILLKPFRKQELLQKLAECDVPALAPA